MAISHFWSLNAKCLSLTVAAFTAGTLGIDGVAERAVAMCADALIVPLLGSPTSLGELWLK